MVLFRLFDSYCEDSYVTRLVFSIYIRRLGRFLLDIALSGLSFLLEMRLRLGSSALSAPFWSKNYSI
jgi:hypothetical protein